MTQLRETDARQLEVAPGSQRELEDLLSQLGRDALGAALGAICIVGVLIGLIALPPSAFDGVMLALTLFALAGIAWGLARKRPRVSAWVLAMGSLLILLAAATVGHLPPAAFFVWAPAGLAALLLGVPSALGVSLLAAMALTVLPAPLLTLPAAERFVAAAGAWGAVGLVWLSLRPLRAAVEVAWESHELSLSVTEQARDAQLRLRQTVEDLTEASSQLARLNRVAEGLQHAAEEARREKEHFVANVSHELRTPLNMIIGFSQMILDSPETYSARLPPALLADLAVIHRNSQHLMSLIDDVLDLSQIETRQMSLVKERASLQEIITAAVTAVRPLFASKGLYLQTVVPQDLAPILCDPTRIREVMLNLLSNAGRFTEAGGVEVHVEQQKDQVLVRVRDTGPGIADGDLARLFKPFQQLDGTIRRRYGGTGLGLSISKSFVELHDGKMWVEAAPGGGSVFSFTLPSAPPPIESPRAARWLVSDWSLRARTRRPVAPHPASARGRLVVCERGGVLQRLLARYSEGVEVVGVDRLEAAETAVSTGGAHAVIINEASFAPVLEYADQASRFRGGTPLLACSIPGIPDIAGSLGASDYLLKPISQEALLTALKRSLPASRPDTEIGRVPTVLVVDDEPDALRLFRRILSGPSAGCRVLTAGDGHSGLEILRREHPDVLLVDLVMHGMDGYQLLAEKNLDPNLAAIPAIIISARDPNGQPVVSSALVVARSGGLTSQQILDSVEALTTILSPLGEPGGPESRETPPD